MFAFFVAIIYYLLKQEMSIDWMESGEDGLTAFTVLHPCPRLPAVCVWCQAGKGSIVLSCSHPLQATPTPSTTVPSWRIRTKVSALPPMQAQAAFMCVSIPPPLIPGVRRRGRRRRLRRHPPGTDPVHSRRHHCHNVTSPLSLSLPTQQTNGAGSRRRGV